MAALLPGIAMDIAARLPHGIVMVTVVVMLHVIATVAVADMPGTIVTAIAADTVMASPAAIIAGMNLRVDEDDMDGISSAAATAVTPTSPGDVVERKAMAGELTDIMAGVDVTLTTVTIVLVGAATVSRAVTDMDTASISTLDTMVAAIVIRAATPKTVIMTRADNPITRSDSH